MWKEKRYCSGPKYNELEAEQVIRPSRSIVLAITWLCILASVPKPPFDNWNCIRAGKRFQELFTESVNLTTAFLNPHIRGIVIHRGKSLFGIKGASSKTFWIDSSGSSGYDDITLPKMCELLAFKIYDVISSQLFDLDSNLLLVWNRRIIFIKRSRDVLVRALRWTK